MLREESIIQKSCVSWFRFNYPHLAKLLYHITNEGSSGNARLGAIRKAEGIVAGAPDLLLNIPSGDYHCLGIEMKTEKGRLSPAQKSFRRFFEAAGNKYVVIRSVKEFTKVVESWIHDAPEGLMEIIQGIYTDEAQARVEEAKRRLERYLK